MFVEVCAAVGLITNSPEANWMRIRYPVGAGDGWDHVNLASLGNTIDVQVTEPGRGTTGAATVTDNVAVALDVNRPWTIPPPRPISVVMTAATMATRIRV